MSPTSLYPKVRLYPNPNPNPNLNPDPNQDGFKSVGPKPSTFSGERALDFVLASRDNMMDKTLMFDLKLSTVKAR